MAVEFLFLFFATMFMSTAIDVDISSVRMDPDLFRLCWKQNSAFYYNYTRGYCQEEIKFPMFKDPQTDSNVYCIEMKDKNSICMIVLFLHGNNKAITLTLKVGFSLPFSPALPIIRKKIVPNGVHFQLSPDFAAISNQEVICRNYVLYGPNKKNLSIIDMNLATTKVYQPMEPGTVFDSYHNCITPNWTRTSSEFVTDHGVVFPVEKTEPLQPFLRFPFRRFLVAQWKNPRMIPDIYKIVIYKIGTLDSETCLKVFRLYSLSRLFNEPDIEPRNCDRGVLVEDLGNINGLGDGNIYVVLDMVVPLKKDTRYKFSIWWKNSSNKSEENFIYFEPLPKENSGKIHPDIYNYQPSHFKDIRNTISDMNQNSITNYSTNILYANLLNVSKYDEMMILPTVSTSSFHKLIPPKSMSYDKLDDKCKKLPSCSNGFHPFFYMVLNTKSETENHVELLRIPLNESSSASSLKLSGNSDNYTFTISWTINQARTNIPGLFAVKITSGDKTKCFALYILHCRTCNKEHKEKSEEHFNNMPNNWNCEIRIVLRNHYKATDSFITFNTKEMIPGPNFIAIVYSLNLYKVEEMGHTNPEYIKISFWREYGIVVISAVCGLIGLALVIFIAIWLKTLVKEVKKDSEVDDSNKYYNEDEI